MRMCLGDGKKVGEQAPRLAYHMYGLCLRSQWPLPCPVGSGIGLSEVELVEGAPALFAEVHRGFDVPPDPARWFYHRHLADGSIYLRWTRLFEFLISADGFRIIGRPLAGASREAFQTYLLGQVISFALLKQGIEALHSTAVVIDRQAVAFAGNSGYGKSSLGAAFLHAGHRLLTDDLLVVNEESDGFSAQPGPPRIKLFPEVALALLGEQVAGVRMNPCTPKLIIPLPPARSSQLSVPLKAIYVLRSRRGAARRRSVTLRRLNQRRACVALIANTFNDLLAQPARLARRLHFAARLASCIPVMSLSYPRDLSRLPEVVEAVRSDVSRR